MRPLFLTIVTFNLQDVDPSRLTHLVIRILTIVLGAIPATLQSLFAMYYSEINHAGLLYKLCGWLVLCPLAWWGTVALWRCAIQAPPVNKLTALGLASGLVAFVGFWFLPTVYDLLLIWILGWPVRFLIYTWFVFVPPLVAAGHLLAAILLHWRASRSY
jgi:hypothetical protein